MEAINRNYLQRHLDILPPEKCEVPVTVIGAGAIGSMTVLQLVKMGFSDVTVYDFDTVSEENMSCQWFRIKDIGKSKVNALQELIEDFTNIKIKVVDGKWDGQVCDGYVITAVDCMATRKQAFDTHVQLGFKTKYIIDPRMSAERALLYVMAPNYTKDVDAYKKAWYSNESSTQESCTSKATMYTACMISGLVCKAMKDLVTDNPYPRVTFWNIKGDNFQSWKGGERDGANNNEAS